MLLCLWVTQAGERPRGVRCRAAGKGELASPLHALHFSGQEEMSCLIGTQPQWAPFCRKGGSSKWSWSTRLLATAEGEMEESVLGSDHCIREMDPQVTLCSTLQRKHWCPHGERPTTRTHVSQPRRSISIETARPRKRAMETS